MGKLLLSLIATPAMLLASPAAACTLCHSRVAEDVRAEVFGAEFLTHLGAVFLPVPLLVAAVIFVRGLVP